MNAGCYNHPDRFALTTCAACGRPLCALCIRQDGRRALCDGDYAGSSDDALVMIEPYRGPMGDPTPAIGLADAPSAMAELKDVPAERLLITLPVQGIIGYQTWRRTSGQGGGLGDALAIISRIPVGVAAFLIIYNLYLTLGGGARIGTYPPLGWTLGIALVGLLIAGIYMVAGKVDPRRVDRTDGFIVAAVDLVVILICLMMIVFR